MSKHQKEISSLQNECASLRTDKEELLKSHQKEKGNLLSESATLRSEKEALLQKQQHLEKDLIRLVSNIHLKPLFALFCLLDSAYWYCYTVYHRSYLLLCCFVSGSSRTQNTELSNSLRGLERSQQELEKSLVALQLQHQQDSTILQSQLDEADNRSKGLQREVCCQNKTKTSTWVRLGLRIVQS